MKFSKWTHFLFFLLLIIGIGFISLRIILLTPGTLGHNWDWSFPPLASEMAEAFPKFLSSWSYASLGSPAILSLPAYLLLSLFFSWGLAGISGEIVSKAVVLSTLIISSLTMFWLLAWIFLRPAKNTWREILPVYLGAIFFGFSPFIFSEMIGGAVSQFFSYPFIPLAILFFLMAQKATRHRWLSLFGTALVLTLLTISTHNLIIAGAILVLLIIINSQRRKYFINLLMLTAFYLILNLYWTIPSISELFFAQTFFESDSFLSLINVIKAAPSIGRSWLQIGYARLFFENILPSAWLPWWILGVGGFSGVLIAAVFKSRNKSAIFWLVIFLAALVFVTAGLPPLGEQVVWLFKNVSLVRGFRSIQHFIPISVLAFTLVLAYGARYIFSQLESSKKYWSSLVAALFILATAAWIAPFILSGDIGSAKLAEREMSRIDNYQLSPGYIRAGALIKEETEAVRFLPLPASFSPVYLPTEYQAYAQGGDPTLSTMSLPVVVADFAPLGYPQQIMQVFENNICEENLSPTDNDQILSMLNIKYVLQRRDLEPNPGSPCAKRWFPELSSDYLQGDKSLLPVLTQDYISLYQLSDYYPRIYAANRNIVINGGVDTLNDIIRHDDLKPANNIFFSDELPTAQPDHVSATYTRLSFEAEDPQYLVSSGIWSGGESKDIVYPSGETAFHTLQYKIPVDQSGRYEFYVKIKQDTNEGLLQTTVDGHEIGQPLDVYYQSPAVAEGKKSYYYKAVRVGEIDLGAGEHEIEFASLPVPAKPLKEYKQSLDQFYLVKKEAGSAGPSVASPPRVEFQEISPTRYHVKVSGATAPYYLNFLETYNSNWQLRIAGRVVPDSQHFVVNGYANSWQINNTDSWEGEIVYHTQELYYLGLWLSGIGGGVLLLVTIIRPAIFVKPKSTYGPKAE